MSEYNISSRYANALIELAEEKGKFEQVSNDVDLIYNTLVQSKELKSVLVSPVIKEEKKSSVLTEIFSDKISTETNGFLQFVLKKNREEYLSGIFKRFLEIRNVKLGQTAATVYSSIEMNEKQKEDLRAKLEVFTNKKVSVDYKTDDNLLGGFRVRVSDTVIDASVNHQLEKLKKKFLSEESEIN